MAKQKVTVRFSPDLHDQIKERAAERGQSVNRWIENAARLALVTKGVELTAETKWSA